MNWFFFSFVVWYLHQCLALCSVKIVWFILILAYVALILIFFIFNMIVSMVSVWIVLRGMIFLEESNNTFWEVGHVFADYEGEMVTLNFLVVNKAVDLVASPAYILQNS